MGKQASILKVFNSAKKHATKARQCITCFIAEYGKLFHDREYIKGAFHSCSDALFESLWNKETITSGIEDILMSARSVQWCINEMEECQSAASLL